MNVLDDFVEDDAAEDLSLPPGEAADQYEDEPPEETDEELAASPFVETEDEDGDGRDWEAEARALGWRDPKEFKPKDGREPVDAKTFVMRGEKNADKRLTTQIEDMSRTMRQMQREQRQREIQATVQGYKRAIETVRAEQQRAKQEYDVDALSKAHQRETEIIREAQEFAAKAKQEAQQEQQQAAQAPDPVYDAWEAENRWYVEDPELRKAAEDAGSVFAAQGLSGRALLDRVAEAVKVAYPQKFTNPRRKQAPASEAAQSRKRRSDPLAKMPNEVRAAFGDFYDEHASEFKSKDHAKAYFLKLMKGDQK